MVAGKTRGGKASRLWRAVIAYGPPIQYRRTMIARLLLSAVLAGLVLATGAGTAFGPATAMAADAKAAPLSKADKADLARVEDYLNGLSTLKAHFIQVSSKGEVAEGTVYLQRPGKIRFEYEPPVPVLIVSSGLILYYHDTELNQTSQVFVNSTPIGLLVREKLSFADKDITVAHMLHQDGAIRVTVQQTKDPEQGAITLIFADKPLALRQWMVLDAQGVETSVTLTNVQTGIALDPALFTFDPRPEAEKGR